MSVSNNISQMMEWKLWTVWLLMHKSFELDYCIYKVFQLDRLLLLLLLLFVVKYAHHCCSTVAAGWCCRTGSHTKPPFPTSFLFLASSPVFFTSIGSSVLLPPLSVSFLRRCPFQSPQRSWKRHTHTHTPTPAPAPFLPSHLLSHSHQKAIHYARINFRFLVSN